MSPRVTIALAVVVALVAAYIFAVDRPMAQRAEEARHLIRFSKAEITGVTLASAKGQLELSRVDATHWQLTRPVRTPAASFSVSDLLDTVTGLEAQRTIRRVGSNLAAYGLDRPVARITLRATGGRTATLEVGKASPVGTGLYAQVVPGSAIYLVDSSIKDALTKSATDLRQKTLADFSDADVQKVRIVSSKETLVVDRLGPDRWRIEGTPAWPADDFKVTDLFFPLTTSEAKVFHDGVTDPAVYGLDHPAVTMDLTMKGRSEPLRVLLTTRGKVAYGMVAGAHTVLELDPSVVTKLTPDPIALVSERVVPYNAPHLTALAWRRNGRTLQVRRQGPGFTGGGLSDKDISDMFSSMNILDADKVERLGTVPPGSPAFEIRTDGAEDAAFLVAFYREPKGGWLAIDRALGLQYRLSANALDGFPQSIKAFLGVAKVTRPAASPKPKGSTPAAPKKTTVPAGAAPQRK
jgi:hypothetical protein